MVKLVDTLDLGSSAVRHGGSSPSTRTKVKLISGEVDRCYSSTSAYQLFNFKQHSTLLQWLQLQEKTSVILPINLQ